MNERSKLFLIINREFFEHLTSAKFALLTVFCLALVFISVLVSTKDYKLRISSYQESIRLKREKSRPWDAWKAFRKPEVLSIFSRGLDKRLGNMVDVDRSLKLYGYLGTRKKRNIKYLSGFSAIDFTFIVRMVFSLSAIFLAYELVSGEREAGTLSLTLSYSVKRGTLLLGKFLGGSLCLLIPLTMSFIIGLLIVQFEPLVSLGKEEYLRLTFLFLVSVLYITAFFALSLLVSCRTKESAKTLLILLIIWVLLLVIVPNASLACVKKFKSLPSREEIDKELEAEGVHHTGYYGDERRIKKMSEQKLFNEMYQQTDLARWISRLSPGAIYSYAVNTLARTGISSYHRFMRFIKDYSRRYEEFDKRSMKDSSLWNDVEEYNNFSATPEPLSDSLIVALPDTLMLFLLNVLFLMGAYLSFLRYEV